MTKTDGFWRRWCGCRCCGQRSFRQPAAITLVDMNCEVEVRDNIKKAIKHSRIVFPAGRPWSTRVSVLTPIAALVSLLEGAAIE